MSEELKVTITADDKASGALKGIRSALGGIGSIAGGVLKVGLVGATAGFAALTAGIGASIHEAMGSEEAITKLNAVLTATKGVAGVTSEQAQDLATSLQKVTKFSDEMVLGAESVLLRFKEINKDVFPEATRLSLDLAESLGIDAASAATMLGKALEDPGVGLMRLKTAGVAFTEEQTKMLKAMTDAGDAAGAQKFILDALKGSIGGAAEAAGTTFGGQIEILKNQFSDVLEVIGGAFLPLLTNLTTAINTNVMPVLRPLAEVFAKIISDLASGNIKLAFDDFREGLYGIGKALGIPVEEINKFNEMVTDIVVALTDAINTGDWGPVIAAFWTWFTGALAQAAVELSKLAGEFEKWANNPETQKTLTRAGEAIGQFIVDIVAALMGNDKTATSIGGSLSEGIGKAGGAFIKLGEVIGSGIVVGIKTEISKFDWGKLLRDILLDPATWKALGSSPQAKILEFGESFQGFDNPGVVAGAYGSPQLVMARGGETFGGFPPRNFSQPDYVIVGFNRQTFQDFIQPFIDSGVIDAQRRRISG